MLCLKQCLFGRAILSLKIEKRYRKRNMGQTQDSDKELKR